jgi:hypothetical protein
VKAVNTLFASGKIVICHLFISPLLSVLTCPFLSFYHLILFEWVQLCNISGPGAGEKEKERHKELTSFGHQSQLRGKI